jgi:hypothetical protein
MNDKTELQAGASATEGLSSPQGELERLVMTIEGDDLVFSNGRRFESVANCGIIGLSRDCTSLYGGYDDGIKTEQWEWDEEEDEDVLTKDEKIALAEYMIEGWNKFKLSQS